MITEALPHFDATLPKWVKSYCQKVLEKISAIAKEILFIGTIATLEVAFPLGNFILWMAGQITAWVLTDLNIKEIKVQSADGFNEDLLKRALQSLKTSLNLQQWVNKQIIVTFVASLITQTVSPVFGIIGLCFSCWQYYRTHHEISQIKKKQYARRDQQLCQSEKSELEKIYQEEVHLYTESERELRKYKFRYIKKLRSYMSIGWEKLLQAKKFSVEQGLSCDCEVLSVLCNMTVLEEIKKPLGLKRKTCPPSLSKRLKDLEEAKHLYMKLCPTEKKLFCNNILNEEEPAQPNVKLLLSRIQSLSWQMFQMPIFQKSIFWGSEKHCLKSWKVLTLASLEKQRLLKYKDQLIFSSKSL